MIYNSTGQPVKKNLISGYETHVNVSALSAGTYIVEIKQNNQLLKVSFLKRIPFFLYCSSSMVSWLATKRAVISDACAKLIKFPFIVGSFSYGRKIHHSMHHR